VVTDDQPGFFQPRMVDAAGRRLAVRAVAVDSVGLLPMSVPDRDFARAYDFRRFLQRTLPSHLLEPPLEDPIRGRAIPPWTSLPPDVLTRWPAVEDVWLRHPRTLGPHLPIDHGVNPVALPGGAVAGLERLEEFVSSRLDRYDEDRNHPDAGGGSGLSPYLHFGHIGAHGILARIARRFDWTLDRLGDEARGQRQGWWGLPAPVESFLDQLVIWRELGHVTATRCREFTQYESLPAWARRTLEAHSGDSRPWIYDVRQLESARTHDEVWNAAQRELLETGTMHNYLRMLWGKKILEWSESPVGAVRAMIELNDKWALDGRDPNSYSGIFWVLGRYDRAWGPERPIFGTVRFLSSRSTVRKLRMRKYLARYGDQAENYALYNLDRNL
jgi:deoxyribodipyrimidine photo-lyase